MQNGEPTADQRSPVARNSFSMFAGFAGRLLVQGAYFVVVARALGVDDFGGFAALTALVGLMSAIGSLGLPTLMLRNTVRDPANAATYFRTALAATTATGLVLTGVLLLIRPWVAPDVVTPTLLLCVAAADFFGTRLVDITANVYIATEQMGRTAAIQVVIMIIRLAGAGFLLAAPLAFTLRTWGLVYALTSVLPAIALIAIVSRQLGAGQVDWRRTWRDLPDGALFSVSFASQSIYSDIDKAMLGRLSTLEATGIYTAAYRIVDMSFAGTNAVLAAVKPRVFKAGEAGLRPALTVLRRVMPAGIGVAAAASLAIVATADLMPLIFGSDYDDAVTPLRVLAVLPFLKALHYFPADALTGAGHQGARSVLQVAVAIINVGLNLWLIPIYSYWGAVWVSLACDGALAVAMWTVLASRLKRDQAVIREPAGV